MRLLFFLILLNSFLWVQGQYSVETIRSTYVLKAQRDNLKKNLHSYTIQQSFSLPLNKETEYRYQSAFWAVSQFLVYNDAVKLGFQKTLNAYGDSLATETRRAFLEAMYTVGTSDFLPGVKRILATEKHPKLSAMIMLWLLKTEPSGIEHLKWVTGEKLRSDSTNKIFAALKIYLDHFGKPEMVPSLHDLFVHQANHGQKIVYSFQNRNRDYPGIAVIQKQDGSFEKDLEGKLKGYGQLARSASNLPYFITNGNTPQGIYAILGTGSSSNNFIGPTPNLQLAMPFEYYWADFFMNPYDTTRPMDAYDQLVPASWKNSRSIHESFRAGEIGRTEIIAHGTTIDPEFFMGKPFYPFSPTLGCLCGSEIWDSAKGTIIESEQLKLVNAFLNSEGEKGYLIVVDFFNLKRALTVEDVEPFIKSFEAKYKR